MLDFVHVFPSLIQAVTDGYPELFQLKDHAVKWIPVSVHGSATGFLCIHVPDKAGL